MRRRGGQLLEKEAGREGAEIGWEKEGSGVVYQVGDVLYIEHKVRVTVTGAVLFMLRVTVMVTVGSTGRYSTLHYDTIQHTAVQYSTVQYSVDLVALEVLRVFN